jgi:hypothetical protein
MEIPPWLAALTGAYGIQAGNGMGALSSTNATGPTLMDAARGIGHDMMEHFRAGQARTPLATPGATTAPGMPGSNQPAPAPVMPMAPPPTPAPAPGVPAFTQGPAIAPPQDLASILSGIGQGVAPHIPQGVPLSKVAIHFAQPGQ